MIQLHMRIQGLQPTKEKPTDANLEGKSKTIVVFCTTIYPSTNKEGKIYSELADGSPQLQVGETNI